MGGVVRLYAWSRPCRGQEDDEGRAQAVSWRREDVVTWAGEVLAVRGKSVLDDAVNRPYANLQLRRKLQTPSHVIISPGPKQERKNLPTLGGLPVTQRASACIVWSPCVGCIPGA